VVAAVVVVRAWVRVDMVVVVVVVVDERWPRGFFSSVVVRAFAQLGALCIVLVEMCVCVCVCGSSSWIVVLVVLVGRRRDEGQDRYLCAYAGGRFAVVVVQKGLLKACCCDDDDGGGGRTAMMQSPSSSQVWG
jgi:hypothetical protein